MSTRISKDLSSAIAVTLAGGLALLIAQRMHWTQQSVTMSVEAGVTTVVVGFVMLLLHRLPYTWSLAISAPIAAIGYACWESTAGRGVALGLLGLELVIMGAIGIAISVPRSREEAPEPRTRVDEAPAGELRPAP